MPSNIFTSKLSAFAAANLELNFHIFETGKDDQVLIRTSIAIVKYETF